MSTCNGCNAEIVWVKTAGGKRMPCDPAIVTVVTDQGDVVKGRVPHWVTCPASSKFRGKEAAKS